jgi:predicted Zn-dependent peptidase
MPEIFQHHLPNGLILLAEPVPSAQSLSMSLLTPAAVALEPAGQLGIASVLSEILCRGAGGMDAKAHCNALDALGVMRSSNAGVGRFRLGATMIGSKLAQALPLLVAMVRDPLLEESALEPTVDLAVQAIESLEDEPQEKVFIELRKRHYPDPFGRSTLGERGHLEAMTIDQVRAFWRRTMVPRGSVLGFAGFFDWKELKARVEQLFGDWRGEVDEATSTGVQQRGYQHENAESTQVHIGLAYDALPEPDERSLLQRAAVNVLSGGMSGRLFTEVREKRGLVYSVYATYAGQRDRGAILSYAGTTAPRAQETLDVLTAELRRLSDGVAGDEFERAIVGMKSRLVMQGESTGARAAAIASDQYTLGRPRTLDEMARRIDAIRLDDLNDFVRSHPPGPMTIVTVGPAALQV